MVELRDLVYYSNLANEILKEDTKYQNDKKLISDIFNLDKSPIDSVLLRLTIIDSYYSTNMDKRLYGFEEISKAILSISENDDEIRRRFMGFVEDPTDKEIKKLFFREYGYKKEGRKFGVAQSIISKYAYFITDYQFPIYDSLVIKSYPIIKKKYKNLNLKRLPREFDVGFFPIIAKLNDVSGIKDFNKLDNLLWLFGKLHKGSFSIILNPEKYKLLVKDLYFEYGLESKKKDEVIRNHIKSNITTGKLDGIFSPKAIEFLDFCYH